MELLFEEWPFVGLSFKEWSIEGLPFKEWSFEGLPFKEWSLEGLPFLQIYVDRELNTFFNTFIFVKDPKVS